MGCNFHIPKRSYSNSDSFQSPLGIRVKCGDVAISSRRHQPTAYHTHFVDFRRFSHSTYDDVLAFTQIPAGELCRTTGHSYRSDNCPPATSPPSPSCCRGTNCLLDTSKAEYESSAHLRRQLLLPAALLAYQQLRYSRRGSFHLPGALSQKRDCGSNRFKAQIQSRSIPGTGRSRLESRIRFPQN